jgi:hypothetical protein
MSDLRDLFDAFYSRLILRDVFGKIVPGSIIIFAVGASLSSISDAANYLNSMPFWFWLFFLGASWITAFSVQAFAEKTRMIRYYSKHFAADRDFYIRRNRFDNHASVGPIERQQLERLVVIKEACGNSYVSVIIAALILILNGLVDGVTFAQYCEEFKKSWHLVLLIILGIIFLAVMHFIHVGRQDTYMNTILEDAESHRQ